MYQILLTTADQRLVSMIQDALKSSPVACAVVDTVQTAARELQSDARPDIVMLDLSIAHALTFLQEMKRLQVFADLPVLALIDEPDSEQIKLALEAGADRWVTTGFMRTTLFSVIKQLITTEKEKS